MPKRPSRSCSGVIRKNWVGCSPFFMCLFIRLSDNHIVVISADFPEENKNMGETSFFDDNGLFSGSSEGDDCGKSCVYQGTSRPRCGIAFFQFVSMILRFLVQIQGYAFTLRVYNFSLQKSG